MFPAQRGLYNHRSTMNQFARPGYSFMNFDPFPFTNANLTDISVKPSTHELSKDDNLSTKKPLSKPDRRAEHNAIERARRENLNAKFQTLAQALPNLMNYRRPSKSQIVEKALDWVNQSISREERYRYQILQLQRENKRLLVQCMHQENVSAPAALPLNPAPASIMYADFTTENNNGWSNDSHLLTITPQMTPCTSTEDLSKQEFGEEDDNASSGNEDDIDYRSSPYQLSTSYLEHGSPQKQYQHQQQQQSSQAFMGTESYPIDYQSQDANFAHHWNNSKYPMYSGDIDPRVNSRTTPLQMLS